MTDWAVIQSRWSGNLPFRMHDLMKREKNKNVMTLLSVFVLNYLSHYNHLDHRVAKHKN